MIDPRLCTQLYDGLPKSLPPLTVRDLIVRRPRVPDDFVLDLVARDYVGGRATGNGRGDTELFFGVLDDAHREVLFYFTRTQLLVVGASAVWDAAHDEWLDAFGVGPTDFGVTGFPALLAQCRWALGQYRRRRAT